MGEAVASSASAVTTVSSKVVYANQWMSLREDVIRRLDGSVGIYAVVDKPDFTLVVPLDNGGFWLVEQYRYPVQGRSWEFPQGTFRPGQSGTAEELARTELAEETGLSAGRLRHLGRLHCAKGMSSQGFDVWVADQLSQGQHHREIEEQDMRQQWFTRAALEDMIRKGEITDDSTLAAYVLVTLQDPQG